MQLPSLKNGVRSTTRFRDFGDLTISTFPIATICSQAANASGFADRPEGPTQTLTALFAPESSITCVRVRVRVGVRPLILQYANAGTPLVTYEIFLEDWNVNEGPHRKVLLGGCEGSGIRVCSRALGRLVVYSGVSITSRKGNASTVAIVEPVVALHIRDVGCR